MVAALQSLVPAFAMSWFVCSRSYLEIAYFPQFAKVHLITKHELLLSRTGMKATNTLEKEHVGY